MTLIEVSALAIVALFVLVRARYGAEPRRFLWRIAILIVASWVAENSCIELYGFYAYDDRWSLFVHHVPLAILLIWPVVIHSAWELARHLLRGRAEAPAAVPLVGAALVLADASMIEPIAVNSGLWFWTEPGLFAVPPIGILGWSFYAGLCMWWFERKDDAWHAAAIIVAPIGTHALLLASWWGLFRWINVTLPPWPFVAVAWAVGLILAYRAFRGGARKRVPPREMWSRVPAALFFFVLIVLDARDAPALIAWALAFAPPYLALTRLPIETDAPGPAYQARK